MIRLLSTLAFAGLTTFTFAQQSEPKSIPRTIEVTGSAEVEVVPDEVYLSVNLREYMKDKSTKVYLTDIEKSFKKVLSDLKIDMKDVSVEGANAYYNYDWWRNESRKTDFLASKSFIIKLPNMEKYNELMQKMDSKGIENAWLQRTDYSKMEELRLQVKLNALKAAKAKAKAMVEAIGGQLGDVVFIREINDNNRYQPVMYKAMANMTMDAEGAQTNEPVSLQKIKVMYEVEAHFVIK
jgi:uncharacterized protein YggE